MAGASAKAVQRLRRVQPDEAAFIAARLAADVRMGQQATPWRGRQRMVTIAESQPVTLALPLGVLPAFTFKTSLNRLSPAERHERAA